MFEVFFQDSIDILPSWGQFHRSIDHWKTLYSELPVAARAGGSKRRCNQFQRGSKSRPSENF